MNGSTQELSSVRPPHMLNSIPTVGGPSGSLASPLTMNSGTYAVIGSLSDSNPWSRATKAAQATKLLVMDAIGKTVSASGTSPSSLTTPNPAQWERPSGVVSP